MQVPIQTAFVTGSSGLLGTNLVRLLIDRGVRVRALARSREKAVRQFGDVEGFDDRVEIVVGDMTNVASFAPRLSGCDVVFHTAAHFRDSYKGGSHRRELHRVNVLGTAELLKAAKSAGVARFVHTSSVAVLRGERGQVVDETMDRRLEDADDYYRSKILSEREVAAFLGAHPDFWACMILPGWMHGPYDLGPTSAGQTVLDYMRGNVPGIVPGSFAVVDARDVAQAMVSAAERGVRGARYLAAGRHMTLAELFEVLESVTGVAAPKRRIPAALLYAIAAGNELVARITGRPVLLSWASVRSLTSEAERSRYDHGRSERELGLSFRPVEETLADEVAWFRSAGLLPQESPTHAESRAHAV
ncbi:MAG: SDR family oxidoreductase [Isosphaeraceae bacterium]|nr:SDR family oxidoreductase [Isosphaeraceae bacterium]